MDQQERLKKLADALANYITNGNDGLVKVSKAAVDEVIMLLKIAASFSKPEPPPD